MGHNEAPAAGSRCAGRKRYISLLLIAAATLTFSVAPASATENGRAFEMVSPTYKGGYGANGIEVAARNGDELIFGSQGAFAGAPASPAGNVYLATRDQTGWLTQPLMPPAAIAPFSLGKNPIDFTPDLGSSLALTVLGPNLGAAEEGTEDEMLIHRSGAPDIETEWTVIGRKLEATHKTALRVIYEGASQDFSHVVLTTNGTPMLAEAEDDLLPLYDLIAGEPPATALRLVSVYDNGESIDPSCEVMLGVSFGKRSEFNAVANRGHDIFFSTNTNRALGGECDGEVDDTVPANPAELFVRVNDSKTIAVSATPSQERYCEITAPCHGAPLRRAEFVGANEAGTCAFFVTAQPLTSGDRDLLNDVYVARIGDPATTGEEPPCGALRHGEAQSGVSSVEQVSRSIHPDEAADVQGVVTVSRDGSHVYFVAHGILTEQANGLGDLPVKGADNLYTYDTTEKTTAFVADLCSGPEESGDTRVATCPANLSSSATSGSENDDRLWSEGGAEAATAADGQILVFTSYAQLTPDDADHAKDVFWYDERTGDVKRVSLGEEGYDANGNNDEFGANIQHNRTAEKGVAAETGIGTRSINSSGDRVVFTTAESLSPADLNGLTDVYEWYLPSGAQEGVVSLVSTGTSNEPVSNALMDETGANIFFVTSQGLLTSDQDGVDDVYDARLGGGFAPSPAPRQPCLGDSCQGPLSFPTPLVEAASMTQPPEGVPPSVGKSTSTQKKSLRRAGKKCTNRPHRKCSKKVDKPKRKARA